VFTVGPPEIGGGEGKAAGDELQGQVRFGEAGGYDRIGPGGEVGDPAGAVAFQQAADLVQDARETVARRLGRIQGDDLRAPTGRSTVG